jgi:hypothetical protein
MGEMIINEIHSLGGDLSKDGRQGIRSAFRLLIIPITSPASIPSPVTFLLYPQLAEFTEPFHWQLSLHASRSQCNFI